MKYEIRADAKSYSEWSVDENGKLNELEHEFEGHDIIAYKIVNLKNLDVFEDDLTFEEAKERLTALHK
jgi:hypothetical protein